ncbi:MAG: Spo0E family sporulation regulatory protein-aspartic acid phosphatase [Clostridiales bacterium]|nr:Spo0E family sporulation regulatory protein-aspartic acid phosphatase [Eubacteriales bacterium]MDH7565708.1 Spo0E family sporulation regulatory protein-aspartic acid phosphatase [Clostridiales bacterium]
MSKELLYHVITKMYARLNALIESNHYDLQSSQVQSYSKRLDRVLLRYSRTVQKERARD